MTQRTEAMIPFALVATMTGSVLMADNPIDTQLPNAPELANYGDLTVGVRQLEMVNPGQIDILSIDPDAAKPATFPTYDLSLIHI